MADYTQARRLMAVSTPLGEDVLLLTGFRARAGLAELFQFDLELLAENATRIDFGALLGQEVTVRITPFERMHRYYSGIVTRLVKGQRDQTFTRYRAEVRPKAWLLTQNVQSRVFPPLSVPDILRQVLGKVLTNKDFVFSNLTGDYQPRDYCVQYRESDFAFASRLMEEEGISFYFRHGPHGHEMVITDTPFDKLDPVEARLALDEVEGGVRTEPRITAWEVCQEVRPRQYVLRDYSFELPDQDLEERQPIQPKVQVGTAEHELTWGNQHLEVYDHPGGYAERFDGVAPGGGSQPGELRKIYDDAKRTVRLRMEAEAAQAIRIDGAGTAASFHPGFHFELTRHSDGDGAYLISRVEHVARLSGLRSGEDLRLDYHNTFSCIPKGLPYRPPRRTPRPVIAGTQTAVVVGPRGQEVFLDKHGRVKVQFHWDRQGKKDANSSCWVRVAQFWAGKGWGAFFWPRIGQEVVVSFEEGDPDRPLVVGSVYNDANPPPLQLPELAAVSGFKSCSTPGGDPASAFNGVLLDDRKGQEHVQIHSEGRVVNHYESSQLERLPGTRVQIVGSLPGLPGSGAGAGPDSYYANDPKPIIDLAKWGWEQLSTWFMDTGKFDVTSGDTTSSVIGTQSAEVIGTSVNFVIDPIGLLVNQVLPFDPAGPGIGSFLKAGLLGSNGATAGVTIGDAAAFQYAGTSLSVSRGDKLEIASDSFGAADAGVKALTVLLTLSVATGNVLKLALTSASETVVNQVFTRLSGFSMKTLPGRLLALLTTLETKNAILQAGQAKLAEAKELMESVAILLIEEPDVVDPLLDAAERRTKESLGFVAPRIARSSGDRVHVVKGNYGLSARDITLRSKTGALEVPAKTTMNIEALGGGALAENGNIDLHGTGQVVLRSGNAMMGFRANKKKGQVMANCGPLGTIELRRGPLIPQATPLIKISNGITIDGGGDPVTVKTSVGGKVVVDLGSVEIQAETINLTATASIAIGMKTGGNKLTITPGGVSLDCLTAKIKSEVQTQIQALQVVQQGKAPSKAGASILNLGP